MFETEANGDRPQASQAVRELDGDVALSLVKYAQAWRTQAEVEVGTVYTEIVGGVAADTVRVLPTTADELTITTTADAGIMVVGYLDTRGFERTQAIQWSGAGTFPADPAQRVDALRVTSATILGGRESTTADVLVKIGADTQLTVRDEDGTAQAGSLVLPRGQHHDFREYALQFDSTKAVEFEMAVTFLRPAGSASEPFSTVAPATFRRIQIGARSQAPSGRISPAQGIAQFDPAWLWPGESKPGWFVTGPIDLRWYARVASGSTLAGITMRGRRTLMQGADADPHPDRIPWVSQIDAARAQYAAPRREF